MEGQACPRCKTTKYRNPSLKLMVNVCGHTLCEQCVDLLFLKGSGNCPDCMIPLRRNNFRFQLFEDPMVQKEVDIRRRILRDYNKKEEDFESLSAYNDYLEEIETLVYNLSNNIDIINTNKRIEAYKRENRDLILRNKSKLGREEYELEEMLELERAQEEARREELLALETEQKKKKAKNKEDLIDELMYSGKAASEIVTQFAERVEQQREEEKKVPPPKVTTEFSTGIKIGRSGDSMFLPVPKADDGPCYVYEPIVQPTDGPALLPPSDIETKGFLQHVRTEHASERAGGFRAALACQRAMQEALQGLYHGATTTKVLIDTLINDK